jgi:hypothetical protein
MPVEYQRWAAHLLVSDKVTDTLAAIRPFLFIVETQGR